MPAMAPAVGRVWDAKGSRQPRQKFGAECGNRNGAEIELAFGTDIPEPGAEGDGCARPVSIRGVARVSVSVAESRVPKAPVRIRQ